MKFTKRKSKVLHLVQNNPMQKYNQGGWVMRWEAAFREILEGSDGQVARDAGWSMDQCLGGDL